VLAEKSLSARVHANHPFDAAGGGYRPESHPDEWRCCFRKDLYYRLKVFPSSRQAAHHPEEYQAWRASQKVRWDGL
jgi:hypothetical protein